MLLFGLLWWFWWFLWAFVGGGLGLPELLSVQPN